MCIRHAAAFVAALEDGAHDLLEREDQRARQERIDPRVCLVGLVVLGAAGFYFITAPDTAQRPASASSSLLFCRFKRDRSNPGRQIQTCSICGGLQHF